MRRCLGVFVLSVVFILLSCKKKKDEDNHDPIILKVTTDFQNGLPQDPNNIDGYIFARYSYKLPYSYIDLHASFGEPSRALIGNYSFRTAFSPNICQASSPNTKVNSVKFGNTAFPLALDTSSGCIYYTQQIQVYDTIINTYFTADWTINGLNNFPSFTVTVPRGFPHFNSNASFNKNISKTSGASISIANFISNYDSLYFVLYQNTKLIVKRFGNEPVINIDTVGLGQFTISTGGPNAYVEFMPINYSHKTITGKRYVFELADDVHWGGFIINP